MKFTSIASTVVAEALTRRCCACDKPKGELCICTLHRPPHGLKDCPTASGRWVHHMREKPKPKGGD